MPRRLPPRLSAAETLYLVRGLRPVVAIALLAGGFWLSPWSPDAVDRPAMLAGWGFPNLAVSAYADLAHGWGPEDARAEALWRGASLAALDLGDPQRAMSMLRELVNRHPAHPRAPEAYARLATLYDLELRDPLRAAEQWSEAAKAAPEDARAGRWWLEAGLAFDRAALPDRAELALRTAAVYPDQAVRAWLALGRMKLVVAPAMAYACYDTALRDGATGEDARLARLGMATALERLDQRDVALAELDSAADAGVDDASLRLRRQRLRARTSP